jgi:predicted GTPase
MREEVRTFLLNKEKQFTDNPLLQDLVQSIASARDHLERREFNLIVVGEATKGKSELINALIGAPILPTAPRPTTMVPHILRWGPSLRIRVVYDGDRDDRNLAPSDLASFGKEVQGSGATIHIESPSAFLKDGLVVIDTPGVNDLAQLSEDILFRQLPMADAALMVFDSRYILTRSEADFLTNYLPESAIDRLLFVLTKMDRLDNTEKKEAVDWAREGFKSLELSQPVFPVSSVLALKKEEGSGIGPLSEGIQRILRAGQGSASVESILDRLTATFNRSALSLRQQANVSRDDEKTAKARVDEFNSKIGLKESEFKSKINELLISLKEVNSTLETDLKLFAMDFRDEISASLKGVEATDVRKYLPFFIRDTFSEWLTKRMVNVEKQVHENVSQLLDDIKCDVNSLSAILTSSREGSIAGKFDSPGVKLELSTGPSGYDFGVACLGVLGTATMFINFLAGGIVTAAAAAAAVGFKRFRDEETIERAIEESPKAVEETWKKLEASLRDQFNNYLKKTENALLELVDDELKALRKSAEDAVISAKRANSESEVFDINSQNALEAIAESVNEMTVFRSHIARRMMEASVQSGNKSVDSSEPNPVGGPR